MSNNQVGSIYQTIIEDVINASRTDFEDQGIEENVLQEMRKVSPQQYIFYPAPLLCPSLFILLGMAICYFQLSLPLLLFSYAVPVTPTGLARKTLVASHRRLSVGPKT